MKIYKILVIEDEAAIRDNLIDALSEEGFEVISGKDGKQGLTLALSENPDLIICDIAMPEMSGLELLEKLRENKVLASFIFLTASVSPQSIRDGMNLGADDYLTKPYKIHQLLAAVYSRLDKLDQSRLHIKNEKQQVRKQMLTQIPDDFSNLLNGMALSFHCLYEATSEEERDTAYRDGIKTISSFAAILNAYYKSIDQPINQATKES
jgi:DNA-binding response OmpR family regulator